MEEVVGEELINQIALESEANPKLVEPKVTLGSKNIPEERIAAILLYQLWIRVCCLNETGAKPNKNEAFHVIGMLCNTESPSCAG
jgi:hypothetical protein